MKKFYFLILFALLFTPICVSAQEKVEEKAQLEAQVDSLELRIAKLEKRAKVWDKLKQHFKISGFIQAQYIWQNAVLSRDEMGVSLTKGESTFNLRRARLSLAGDIFRGKKAGRPTIACRLILQARRRLSICGFVTVRSMNWESKSVSLRILSRLRTRSTRHRRSWSS
jgi:hypothetical protein